MLHMLRSRAGCLAGLLAVLLWTSTIAPLGAQAPEPAAQQTPARQAGGEANLILPDLGSVDFQGYSGRTLLTAGLFVSLLGLVFGMVIFVQLRNLPVHRSMHEISELIYETRKN
jgi:K(+)-stimulated pyrophosphate-energized sodium pump